MEEYQKPWAETNVFKWYDDEYGSHILVPFGDQGESLAIVEALGTIHECLEEGNPEEAKDLVVMMGELIVGIAMGAGKQIMEDIIVNHQAGHLDEALDRILSEELPE